MKPIASIGYGGVCFNRLGHVNPLNIQKTMENQWEKPSINGGTSPCLMEKTTINGGPSPCLIGKKQAELEAGVASNMGQTWS